MLNTQLRQVSFSLIIISAVALLFSSTSINRVAGQEGGRKIITWQTGANETDKDELINRHGGTKIKNLSGANNSVVWLPNKSTEKSLGRESKILRIEEDALVTTLARDADKSKTGVLSSQTLPWGVDRIDAELVWPSGNTGDPIKVAIIDTGISKDHPDLKNNIKGGYNAINPTKHWNDDNGHGSHVAGIVAALDNTQGVIGVAPAVDLYAVKVLNRKGSGFTSDVIEGINWAVANNIQVANLSLGSAFDIQALHDAIITARNAGLIIVAAAGNSGGAVIYPAAYPETIAVSATDSNNNLASFSSRGPEIDLAAPGINIYSTYKGTGYAILSGTSMAAPHVTGATALVLNTPVGTYDANGDSRWNPSEVQKKLQDRATDFGNPGFDNLYGWGLINANSAVQP